MILFGILGGSPCWNTIWGDLSCRRYHLPNIYKSRELKGKLCITTCFWPLGDKESENAFPPFLSIVKHQNASVPWSSGPFSSTPMQFVTCISIRLSPSQSIDKKHHHNHQYGFKVMSFPLNYWLITEEGGQPNIYIYIYTHISYQFKCPNHPGWMDLGVKHHLCTFQAGPGPVSEREHLGEKSCQATETITRNTIEPRQKTLTSHWILVVQ